MFRYPRRPMSVAAEHVRTLPTRLGGFRIVEVIGQGGMGIVYRAVDRHTNEAVAIKTVTVNREFDLGGIRREIHTLQRLDHPGVVRIVASGVHDGIPWYAMPILEGETLAARHHRLWRDTSRRIADQSATRVLDPRRVHHDPTTESPSPDFEGGPLTVHEGIKPQAASGQLKMVLDVARGLSSTLAYVHGEGVVHRDLKTSNVFLCSGDEPKLIDLGLVWRFGGAASREVLDDVSAHVAGTAGYMAPEQIRGELVDARADLYALGCVLYELLTGRLPFVDQGPTARQQHLDGVPIPPSLLVDGLPRELEAIVLRLLEKRPDQRFGHAAELVPLLDALGARRAPWEHEYQPRAYVYRPTMVGRREPLAKIDARIGEALELRGGITLIAGESGIGKTYLAMAAGRDAWRYGMQVITGAALPLSAGEPGDAALHPFRPFLGAVVDRCLAAPELTGKLIGGNGRVLAQVEPRLLALQDVQSGPAPEEIGAQASQRRLLAALAGVISAHAESWPCLLLIDDLQWADELTMQFLTSLPGDWFEGRGLIILGTYRADEESAALSVLQARPYVTRIDLGRLDEADVIDLVRDMLALPDPPVSLVSTIAAAAEGNPFFVAEYLRTAVDEGLLRRDRGGAWQIDATSRMSLPATIDALVSRRLAGLSKDALAMVQAAAVLGKEIDPSLAGSMLDLDLDLDLEGVAGERRLLEAVRELVARQVLEERGSSLGFLHDRLRATTYDGIQRDLRAALHRKAATAIEARAQGTPDFPLLYATLARHYVEAKSPHKSVHYSALAGEQAMGNYANREAVAHLSAALDLADEASVDVLTRARWERRIAECSFALGDMEAVDEHVRRSLSYLGTHLPATRGQWAMQLLRELPVQIRHRFGGARVPALEEDRARSAEAAYALHQLAERAYYGFDALAMVGASLWSVNHAESGGVKVAQPYGMLGLTLGLSKLRGLARRYFALARDAAESTADDLGLGLTLIAESSWYLGEGDWAPALRLTVEAAVVARRTNDQKNLGKAETLRGHVAYYTGSFAESAQIYGWLEDTARKTYDEQHLAWGLYATARALIPLGRLEEALVKLREAHAILERGAEAPSKIICPGLLASTHLRLGALEAATEMADLCADRIRANIPSVFSTVAGYAGVAEVYLARLAAKLPRALERARWSMRQLALFAFSFPFGAPTHLRLRGELEAIEGKNRRAVRSLKKALVAAQRLSMPYEEALAHAALARRLPTGDPQSKSRHGEAARVLLTKLGCSSDLVRMGDVFHGEAAVRRA